MYGTEAPMISLYMLIFLLLQLSFRMPLVISYNPVDKLAVSCGYSGNANQRGRNWVGDIDSKLFSTIEPQNVQPSIIKALTTPPSVDVVPYDSARIFRSQFTYSFPLKSGGPKFLRLHFYPTTYDNFEIYNSLFSVTADNFTLLKDFNASLWLRDGEDTVSKEYLINVEAGQRLNLTFVPSTKQHQDAYAFINGIEVVSMPPFLYYSDPNSTDQSDNGIHLVGYAYSSPYQLELSRALETLYRVNVGGRPIPPEQDTGMFRNWESDDDRYLVTHRPRSQSAGFGLHVNLKNNTIPDYTAPEELYLTSRSYGMNATENYNVTWLFDVDSKFTYMVRLHFCEFEPEVQNLGDRIFQIFIAETMAEDKADVIEWSTGNLIPVHRDYAVFMSDQRENSNKVTLSIKLQRLPIQRAKTNYYNVILNGVEIFKISDESQNLAGSNPDPMPPQPKPFYQSSNKSSKKTIIVAFLTVVVSSLLLASVIGLILFRRKRSSSCRKGSTKKEGASSSLPSHLCRYFTIAEIRAATNNFDDVFIVGVGGFGNVYKGYIDDGATPVAIKRLKPGSQQGINEFLNEIDMLSQLRHLHLVSLIGYCNDGVEMILVYDFMQRGTLREYLYGSDNNPLPWKQRLEILLGAARGLHYLHAGAKHNIIHRDVKSTNILLDEKWVAKVSDFGLSKVGPTGMSTTHVSTFVKGSLGYLDPEYYKRQRLTLKSDVYSFGVVLLEVLCARPPLIRNVDKHKASLVDWVRKLNDQGKLDQTVDIFLKGSITPECLKWYGQLAMSCLHDDGNQRPSMNDVVGALEFAMQLAEGDKDKSFGGAQDKEKGEESPLIPQFTSDEGSDVLFTSDESGTKDSRVTTISGSSEERAMISGLVFSEIGDPRAR
ncbi:hypothetical protein HN51_067848 [Arachis hypogaea]|uniref:receptor-like protein kinase FERONIA n=1 Tax=Arachis ipaensis TaxID=130454 RepID=UPI0007AF1542|nr:receptor-like protein kinase FERONIA [Arachis ipaensis]QHO09343.1 Receptor-like protein kinase FERONIA [Arachis hypogaea]